MLTLDELKHSYPEWHNRPRSVPHSVTFPGATRNFSPRAMVVARFVAWKWDVVPHTYDWHGVMPDGSNGEAFAMDIHVAPDNAKATQVQREYGDTIWEFFGRPAVQEDVGLMYRIWWAQMAYAVDDPRYTGVFDYTPFARDYCRQHGNADWEDCIHENHVHLQFYKRRS